MDDLPQWAGSLKNLYCCLRAGKRNKALRRKYYRQIQVEKLRLAEFGVDQDKIRQVCRFLSNVDCVRGSTCKSCERIREFLRSPDLQSVFVFLCS